MQRSHSIFFKLKLRQKGFTLIELLIVIAIILILIAIALPNFLEAQERARVVRAKGHLRTMETAIMSFMTDYGYLYADYNDPLGVRSVTRNHKQFNVTSPCPTSYTGPVPGDGGIDFKVDQLTFYPPGIHCPLTTPIPYIKDEAVVTDPWSDGTIPVGMDSRYVSPGGGDDPKGIKYSAYFVSGPDRSAGEWLRGCEVKNGLAVGCVYNPTNGTKSLGELWMVIAEDTQFAKNEYIPLRTF